MKGYRYNILQRELKRVYRKFSPVPRSPWTAGEVEDICAVNSVPPDIPVHFFKDCIELLEAKKKKDAIGDYLEFGIF